IPYFVVIVIIQFVFYFELSWLPSHVVATSTDFASNYWWALSTYFMPVAVLTLVSVPGLARSVRAELTEQLTQDYMLLARSKGLTKRQATFRHALKNALVPFLPGIFIGIIGIINGGLITEKLFRV